MLAILMQAAKDTSGHFQAGRIVGAVIGGAVLLLVILIIVKKARGK